MSKLRIALVELYCGASGQIGYYNSQELGLAKAYKKLGNEVFIFYPSDFGSAITEERVIEGITIVRVPAFKIGVHSFYSLKVLKKYSIDIVHMDSDNQIYAPSVMRYCEKNNIKVYNYIGTLYSDSHNKIKKYILDILSRRNVEYFKKHPLYAKTDDVKAQLISEGAPKCEVLPVGFDDDIVPDIKESIEELRIKRNIPLDKKVILFVGRLEEYKQPFDLFKLAEYLDDNIHYIIIGSGSLKDKFLEKADKEISYTYVERIQNKEIYDYYKLSDCFVNFNTNEIFGMCILEAMYEKLPVLAIKAPGPLTIIENNVSGFICENIRQMSELIIGIMSDEKKKKKLGEEAKRRVENYFSWIAVAERILSCFDKQNVLIVHNYYQIPGGEDTVVSNEKDLLEKNGHKAILYSRDNSEIKEMNILKKLFLPFISIYNPKTYKDIKNIIEKEDIDIVHVHNTLSLVSPSVYYAALSMKVPVLQTIHNYRLICPAAILYRNGHICEECIEKGIKCAVFHKCYRDSLSQTLVCVVNSLFHRMMGIYKKINYVCLTNFNKEKLLTLKQIQEKKIYVKPNFIQERNFEAKKMNTYIYVGRLEEIKGIKDLLEAWKKLNRDDIKLLICGTGPLDKECIEYTKDNHMQNVEFLGYVEHDEVIRLIASSRYLILPTRVYEGFPMTIIEAFSVGTPVIVPNKGNAADIVSDGVTGYKYEYGNALKLMECILHSIDSHDLSKHAFDEYCTKYTDKINYGVLRNIYNSIGDRDNGF